MGVKDFYNKVYSNKKFYWGLKPPKIVKESTSFLDKKSKVLDLGCGEGKNSIYLAKKGFDVVAVDISKEGIKKLKLYSKNKKIKTSISEANKFMKRSCKYSAIYAINLLQFIDNKSIKNMIKLLKEKTLPNGINVISAFVSNSPKQKNNAISKGRYLFDSNELKEFYEGWDFLEYKEFYGPWEQHGDGPSHQHHLVKMIARKK